MQRKVKKFISEGGGAGSWQIGEEREKIEFSRGEEKAVVFFVGEKVKIETSQGVGVYLSRGEKIAKFREKTEGKTEIGDRLWLLSPEAEEEFKEGKRENFNGEGVKIEFENEEKEPIFVNEKSFSQSKSNKNINLILGLVVLGLLVAGTILGYQKRKEEIAKKRFEEVKIEVEKKITEIEGVRTVNIDTALELAKEAEEAIDNAGVRENKYNEQLSQMKEKVAGLKKELGGESVDYEVAYDTGLIKEGNNMFNKMAIKGEIVYLWSRDLGQVNKVDIDLKSTEKVVGDEKIKSWIGIFNSGEKWYGYDQAKIYEIKKEALAETEIKEVKTLGEMSGWNGLIYAIDNGSQNIQKLTEGEGKKWLKEGESLREEMTAMSIDSSIWLLGKSGKIYHYNRGSEEKVEMSFVPNLSEARALRSSSEVDFLAYIAEGNTVLIYGKDGKILRKFNFGKIKINDLAIEEAKKAVLVLAENGKIYRIINK